ncbi:MAG: DUF134 domain-containing protein [Methanomassiliicoccales archaeon]
MPRPKRCRRISCGQPHELFKPHGIPWRDLEQVMMGVDELEAVRLADLEMLNQLEAAERMGVSQPTFSRILASGRRKMAEAVIHGKALRIIPQRFTTPNEEVIR